MVKVLLRAGLAAALAGLLPGCGLFNRRPSYPEAPLLAGKRWLHGKAVPTALSPLAQAEPVVPSAPPAALAAWQALPASLLAEADMHTTPRAVPAQPAVRSSAQAFDATTTSRRPPTSTEAETAGNFLGHASDYSWIQGILVRERGRLHVHYGQAGSLSGWNGKIDVEDDPRLRCLREGTLVRIEGEIVRGAEHVSTGDPLPYRIQTVRLLPASEKAGP